MYFRSIVWLGFAIVMFYDARGQRVENVIEQIIEKVAAENDDATDYSELTENLVRFQRSPLDINTATYDQLQELIFLNPQQINGIIRHREQSGPFADLLELQSVEELDERSALWLSGFLKVNPRGILDEFVSTGVRGVSHDLIIRYGRVLSRQHGYEADGFGSRAYQGSPERFFTRYRLNSGRIDVYLNIEKDAGEKLFRRNLMPDFVSGSVQLKGTKAMERIVLGDYSLQFGQGLAMWTGLGFGKGSALTSLAKPESGLRPYGSSNEYSFLRGIAARYRLGRMTLTPFVSRRLLDASIADGMVRSINKSGLHRTVNEIQNRQNVSHSVVGFQTQYRSSSLSAGSMFSFSRFGQPLAAGRSLYQKYNFYGQSLMNGSLHYSYSIRNLYLFGEIAHSFSSGTAVLNGTIASLTPGVSVGVIHRVYAKNYHALFADGFGESSGAANEGGLFAVLNIKPSRNWDLLVYGDSFRFPWLKFGVDAPSAGYEAFGLLTYSYRKDLKAMLRYKHEFKQENFATADNAGLADKRQSSYRAELSTQISKSIQLRTRMEFTTVSKEGSGEQNGFMSSQDLIYDPLSSKLSGNLRFAIFHSQDFDSRIYAYENDVLYGYSIPAYQGKGIRWYVNTRYTLRRGIDLWLRYSNSSYQDTDTIGSGNDAIAGSRKDDFRIQLRFQLRQ